eukprot:CAMPEP_0115866806 /NCGR_PEP_ID=MMETSP0287-20121206/20442_1 /TAXON_ID=412157 /ORGANISM="Chrysochromulina rotalis, Strain UIO044" /LENGTH=206 /DNA_ID=CAMNT_0003321391 /DNA_START=18 /DNA_END=638 /DNA_ORIENTATION=-
MAGWLLVGGLALFVAPQRLPAHSHVTHAARTPDIYACADDSAIDVESAESVYAQCLAMKVSEIKAELELRKISWEGLFEKEELAKLLAESRRGGRADPTLLDDFNRESVEKAFRADEVEVGGQEEMDLNDVTAGDGALPGGMSPEMLQAATQNPEIMAILRNPKLQDIMRTMMSEGAEATQQKLASDPEARELLTKFQSLQAGLGN